MSNSRKKTWHDLTDPKNHDENFLYLVHAIKDPYRLDSAVTLSFMLQNAIKSGSVKSKVNSDLLEGEGTLEEKLREKISGRAIAASLINNKHVGLWSDQGLILELDNPERDIIATEASDLGSLVYSLEDVKKQFAYGRIMSPDELLLMSGRDSYNEVVISGEYSDSVKVVGIVVKVDRNNKPLDDYGARLAGKAAKEGLPVIRIKKRIFSLESKIVRNRDIFNRLPEERQDEITSISYVDSQTMSQNGLSFHGFKEEDNGLYTTYIDQFFEDGLVKNIAFMKLNLTDDKTLQEVIRVRDKGKALEILETLKTTYSDCFHSNSIANGGETREGVPLDKVFESVYGKIKSYEL